MEADVAVTVQHLLDTIFKWGPIWVYLIIFAACFIENIVPPFPGDTFIAVAGALVAAGRLDPVLALLVVCTGGLASVMILYHLGHKYGRDFFNRKNYRFFSRADIARIERLLAVYGPWILMFHRFIVGVRAGSAIAAGIAGYNAGRMLLYSAISYVLFGGLVMILGYVFVENLEKIKELFQTYNSIIWPIVVIALIAYIVWRIRKRKRKHE